MIKGVGNKPSEDNSKSTSSTEGLSYEQMMKLKYGSLGDKIQVVQACLKERAPDFIRMYLSNPATPITRSPQLNERDDDLYYHPNLRTGY